MTEKTNVLKFLLEEPSLPFRVVKRKGELRYIASDQRGSLAAVTKFAPPSKRLPKLLLGLLGIIDFRVPSRVGLTGSFNISKAFLDQVAALLTISIDRVGIYVGEPDDRRKLVIIDVEGQSAYVLKIAVGKDADEAIRREAESGRLALDIGRWEGLVPDIRSCDPVCGRPAILIERIKGRQLTPEEFEAAFFGEESGFKNYVLGFRDAVQELSHSETKNTESLSIEEWMNKNPMPSAESLTPLLTACRECGALDLLSPLGVVHGDFTPWNVIRRQAEQGARHQVSGVRKNNRNPVPPALCAVDWEFSHADTPLIFDMAYAAWCYAVLLNRTIAGVEPKLWSQLVALGALWFELRKICR